MNEREMRIECMTLLSDLKGYWNMYKDEMDKECHRNYIDTIFENGEKKLWEIIMKDEG